jgi:ribosomal protein S3
MHGKFFGFIKTTIQTIVNYPYRITTKDRIEGIRMVISGRLKGKQRSGSKRFWAGNVPTQSLAKNVEFCSTPSITLYGTFGLKFWIYKTRKSLTNLNIAIAR